MQRLIQWRSWALEHERMLSVGALLLGFLWDSLTASRPDTWFTNITFISYFLILVALIVLFSIRGERGTVGPIPILTFIQFCFGNIASALLVLYGKSGTLVGSGIFVAALVLFLILNEFLRNRYARVRAQIATWFLLLVPYLAMAVPIVLGTTSLWVFLLSGALAGLAAIILVAAVRVLPQAQERIPLATMLLSLGLIYALFFGLYMKNLLPPVPLSLSQIGIYHTLSRTDSGNYAVTYEPAMWPYSLLRDTSRTYHQSSSGSPVYCFSAVFAPTGLSTAIYHRWEKKQVDGSWLTTAHIVFPINGGRDAGYRGYTVSYRVDAGEWRCSVETERGALIGRTTFTVALGDPAHSVADEF
jgi:hypothetical protein